MKQLVKYFLFWIFFSVFHCIKLITLLFFTDIIVNCITNYLSKFSFLFQIFIHFDSPIFNLIVCYLAVMFALSIIANSIDLVHSTLFHCCSISSRSPALIESGFMMDNLYELDVEINVTSIDSHSFLTQKNYSICLDRLLVLTNAAITLQHAIIQICQR